MPRGMIDTFCTGSTPGQRHRHQRVAHLVMRDDIAFVRIEDAVASLQARDDAFDRLGEILQRDVVGLAPRRQQRRLVDEIGEIGAGEAGRQRGDRVESTSGASRIFFRCTRRISDAALAVGPIDENLAVEAAGAQQRGVEDFRAGWSRPAATTPAAGIEAVQFARATG